MKKLTSFIAIILIAGSLYSQEATEEFKPSGKPFIKVFTNFHTSIIEDTYHDAFEIQRAYLGYSYNLSKDFSGKVCLDVGDPGAGKFQFTAFLKNAYFQYEHNRLAIKFGLVGTTQFELQEKQWGGRYLYKSFQDEYKFGHSADLAAIVSYKIHDMISIDVSCLNGEGYKSIESDSILKYSAGVTFTLLKGLDIRAYYDYMGKNIAQQTISLYAGYGTEKIKFGAEYNYQLDGGMVKGQDQTGMSFFGSYKLKKARLFARYDQLSSVKISSATDPWNYGKDGQLIIGGIEFEPVKGIKIAPNYQAWIPADGSAMINVGYISCEIAF